MAPLGHVVSPAQSFPPHWSYKLFVFGGPIVATGACDAHELFGSVGCVAQLVGVQPGGTTEDVKLPGLYLKALALTF